MSTTVTYKGSTLTTVNNQTRTLKTAGKYLEDDVTLVDVSGSTINNQNKSVTPTESTQTVTYDSGYTGLNQVEVGAISSTYVGSGISRNDSDDLTVNGATITVAAGYYESSASKTVASGTAGTPTAAKGTVSNHSISVTPSVTNTTGYITGGTKTGTAVTVSASELVSGTKSINANDTGIDVTNYASVDVSVTPRLQSKTNISPTESSQTITADSNYDGLSSVQINAVSSTYVGSEISRRSSTDLTVSGATITAPAGYYSSQASKSVSSMTLPTSASSSASSGYTSKATIGRSTSNQYINIPTGYNSAGAYYLISATPNGSVTAPSTISGTTATVSTGTNTITLTKSISVTPNVTTAGYISTGTAGNSNVSLTANVTTKAAATITPGTTNQTISSGTYLTGTQTISGDSDLTAANIKSGVSIFNVNGTFTSDANATATDILNGKTAYVNGSKVTGTLAFQTIYSGSSTPSSSTGVNGDVYIQV